MDRRINHKTGWLLVAATFLVAFVLTFIPMPLWTVWLRPAWVLIVTVYWIQLKPPRAGMLTAWFAGLFLDVLNGTLLGEHALAMTVAAFIAISQCHRFRMFPLLQQGLGILLMVFVYQLVLFCIQGFLGELPVSSLYWLGPLTSMLIWPWVSSIIQASQQRFVHS